MPLFYLYLIYLLCFYSPISFAHKTESNQLISIKFNQAPLAIILQSLANHQKLNLVMNEQPNENLTIHLENVPWQQALDLVLRASKLSMTLEGNVMLINQQPDPQWLKKQKEQEIKEQESLLPLKTLTLKINYADINQLEEILNSQKGKLLTDRASVFADIRTGRLIIQDVAHQLPQIKQLIQELDIAKPQVQISAQIVTITSESLKELGVKWTLDNQAARNNLNLSLPVLNPTTQMSFQLARFNSNLLHLELSALEAENNVEIIANPRLLTANQQTASIKQGTEIPYEVSNGYDGTTSIEFKQAVLGLEVTPKILNNNKLELALYISQNTPGQAIKRSDGGEALTIDTQEIKTQIIIEDGETLVLGGIFQQGRTKAIQSVPILSRIPLIGNLFQHNINKQNQRELIIFITPKIIKENHLP